MKIQRKSEDRDSEPMYDVKTLEWMEEQETEELILALVEYHGDLKYRL